MLSPEDKKQIMAMLQEHLRVRLAPITSTLEGLNDEVEQLGAQVSNLFHLINNHPLLSPEAQIKARKEKKS